MSDDNMKINNIDDEIDFDSINFDNARPVSEEPMLARLQAQHKEQKKKEDISIRIDLSTVEQFKNRAKQTGDNYQSLINQALKEYLITDNLQEVIKNTIRQEMRI